MKPLAFSLSFTLLILAYFAKGKPLSTVADNVVAIEVEGSSNKSPKGYINRQFKAYHSIKNLDGRIESGSGFFYRYRGSLYVVTNAHVIDGALRNGIRALKNGIPYSLREIGGDTFYDIAVLALTNPQQGQYFDGLQFSRYRLEINQPVYAVASPPGIPDYVESGKISAVNLELSHIAGHHHYVESSARIIPGCSGSPLVNEQGEVVGINTKRDQAGARYFAIHGAFAERLIQSIIDNRGRVRRAYLGLQLQQNRKNMQAPPTSLPLIQGIVPNSPASSYANDFQGAYLSSFNEYRIETVQDFLLAMEGIEAGHRVSLGISKNPRGGAERVYTLTTEVLSEQALEDIAYFFVESSQLQIIPGQFLRLEGNLSGNNIVQNPLGQVSISRVEGGMDIVSSGLGDGFEGSYRYKVNTMKDLGVMIRLCSLAGHVDLQGLVGDEIWEFEIYFRNRNSFSLGREEVLYH